MYQNTPRSATHTPSTAYAVSETTATAAEQADHLKKRVSFSVDDAADWVRLPEFFQGCFDRRWINGQVRSISFLVGSFSNASSVFCFFFIPL